MVIGNGGSTLRCSITLPPFVHPGRFREPGLETSRPWIFGFAGQVGGAAIFQITQKKRIWLLTDSFVISEVSSLVLGYLTCPVLNLRPHGDWVMSFSDIQKGANRGLVSVHGRKTAQFSFLNFRRTSTTNHTTSRQQPRSGSILESM